jgi:hypothetical protein
MSAVFPCSRESTQKICNKNFIAIAILGKCIVIGKLSVWKWRMHINTPWMAYLLFHNFRFPQGHLVVQVVFRVVVPPVLVEVRQFLYASSRSAGYLLYHFGMEGSWPYDFCKPLLGVVPSQPSPSDAQETQLLASSLLGLLYEVS